MPVRVVVVGVRDRDGGERRAPARVHTGLARLAQRHDDAVAVEQHDVAARKRRKHVDAATRVQSATNVVD